MLFNSIEFILGFLPIVLVVFFVITRTGRPDLAIYFLSLASIFFYGWWNWSLVGLLLCSIIVNFLLGRGLARRSSRAVLVLGLVFNLGLLGWFKYAGFFSDILNAVANTSVSLGTIVLPLGISFFTFQQIAFLIDAQRGIATEPNLGRYALFVTFFPQLIAGPIVHHGEILPQYARSSGFRLTYENLSIGLTIFTIGLFKKVVLADPMGAYADMVFGAAAHGDAVTFVSAWAGTGAFALEIYFDFSGYSDMAIGLARLFGIKLPLNFNSPYKAASIIDFWRRWHMTLSRFLRDYLYFPLGGNRKGSVRRYGNLMIVMLLGGLWHGAAWNFVLWGVLHGLFLVMNQGWRRLRRVFRKRPQPATLLGRRCGQALTLVSVMLAWVFFRAEGWEATKVMLAALSGASGVFLPSSYASVFGSLTPFLEQSGLQFGAGPDPAIYPTLLQFLEVVALFGFVLVAPNTQEWMERTRPALDFVPGTTRGFVSRLAWRPNIATGIATAAVFSVTLGFLLGSGRNEFIYFQF